MAYLRATTRTNNGYFILMIGDCIVQKLFRRNAEGKNQQQNTG
jgi:hypothetical protein